MANRLTLNESAVKATCQGDLNEVEQLFKQGADNYDECVLLAIQHRNAHLLGYMLDTYEDKITKWHEIFKAICKYGTISL